MIITKSVLLLGVMIFAALLLIQSPVVEVIYLAPGAPPKPGFFEGVGPIVKFWIGLLAIALALDYLGSRLARNAVRPFASALNEGQPSEEDDLTQVSQGGALTTSASGSAAGRLATVTLRQTSSRTGPTFRVDVVCHCPLVLEIRRRSIGARLLGLAGAVVATGDPLLDAAVVVQADDEVAIRRWLAQPTVRNNLLPMFEQHKVASLSLCDGGSVLRAEFLKRGWLVQPQRDADAIVKELSALARSLESLVT